MSNSTEISLVSWLLVWYVFHSLILILRRRPAWTDELPSLACSRCKYDLTGLAEATPCPECGEPRPGLEVVKHDPSITINAEMLAKWVLVAAVGWCVIAVSCTLATELVGLSYAVQGYAWNVCKRAATSRELLDTRTSGDSTLWCVWPLVLAMCVSNFTLRLRPWRWAWWNAALLLCGLLGCLARWTLPYLNW